MSNVGSRAILALFLLDASVHLGCSNTGSTTSPPEGGTPYLTQLVVTSTDAEDSSITLVPPFVEDVHDYYVRCAAGENALKVAAAVPPGGSASVKFPMATPKRPTIDSTVNVEEGKALVVTAWSGTSSTDYWVRCLPHDFPPIQMKTYSAPTSPPPGYYLIGNLELRNGNGGYAMIVDQRGVPVWYFREPTGYTVSDVDSVVPGAMTFVIPALNAFIDEPFELHQIQPQSSFTFEPEGFKPDEHELQHLPNGNFIVLSYPFLSGVDLTGLSYPPNHALGPNSTIQDCEVVEFERSGHVVWKWSATRHFDPAKVSTLIGFGFKVPNHRTKSGDLVYDPYHCNSIDVDPANGNLLVSSRHMSSIFYIDHATQKVLWKMGGPESSKDDTLFVKTADSFNTQHDARMMPGWSASCHGGRGQISMFDDESETPKMARGVVYDVDVGGSGATGCEGFPKAGPSAGTANVVWQFQGVSHSAASGSFRILPDGSHVIGWGYGDQNPAFTEVDIMGHRLLDFSFPEGSVTFRAIKVPLSAFDLDAMRNDLGN